MTFPKALSGLGKVSEGIDGVDRGSAWVVGPGTFRCKCSYGYVRGNQTEEDAKRAQQLQKILALLSIVQQVNTNVLKEGIVQIS